VRSFKFVFRIKYFEENKMRIGIQRGWGRGGTHTGTVVGKLERKRPPGRSGLARKDNIETDIKQTECNRVDWIR
jgi:hypothetical protein